MTINDFFTTTDIAEIKKRGIEPERIIAQIETFRKGIPPAQLLRPATPGDGIVRLSEDDQQRLVEIYKAAAQQGRALKFVPASGAATRMMKTLLRVFNLHTGLTIPTIEKKARKGEPDFQLALRFFQNLPAFAFYEDLQTACEKQGSSLPVLLKQGNARAILAALLLPDGLGYANMPKGLIKFHAYPDGARTPFEEHLVEAIHYTSDARGTARLHFTISPEHAERIENYLRRVLPLYKKPESHLQIEYSYQKPSTDTIAVDLNNNPLRDKDGRLVFRPGGHGALLENLNDLKGDIIFIKNIDNVVPDRLKEPTVHYKMVLGGYLVKLQERIFEFLRRLDGGTPGPDDLREMFRFAGQELSLYVHPEISAKPESEQREYLISLFNRPIRVCGMVKNEGEPGGGPFWVAYPPDGQSLQIVESAEVDMADPRQRRIWESSTHFNPVDLVCGVQDFRGNPFDLTRFSNPNSGFISIKSVNGQEVKALELPGLWNGGMANWITVFVEVPIITFNPVKTIFDLLRPEHQPE